MGTCNNGSFKYDSVISPTSNGYLVFDADAKSHAVIELVTDEADRVEDRWFEEEEEEEEEEEDEDEDEGVKRRAGSFCRKRSKNVSLSH